MTKIKRAELIEQKLEQLRLYHDTKCPNVKLSLVERMIARYERILDTITSNLSLSHV